MTQHILFFEETPAASFKHRKTVKRWLTQVAVQEKHLISSLNIILCSDSFLKKLNIRYLQHDTLTDVITFSNHKGKSKTIDGEIYISYPRVKENATLFNTATAHELHRVMVHGLLHLTGYSDKTRKDQKEMRAKENLYLNKLSEKLQS